MKYQVGQHVEAYTTMGRIYGRVVEIDDIPERRIFQLKLQTDWCVHPREEQYKDGGDRVLIVDKCNCGECK